MERSTILKVMVPVGGFGLLLLIVGVVVAMNAGGSTPTSSANLVQPAGDPGKPSPGDPQTPPPPSAVGEFDFPLDGPEWKDLGNGLKMWEVKVGSGDECPSLDLKPNAWPVMHYTGWLTTGKLFDSSKKTGRPLDQYPLGQLIKGWQKGVPGMKVGGVRRLLIPSDLGYGQRGSPPDIPGGATLVFEMHLVGFK